MQATVCRILARSSSLSAHAIAPILALGSLIAVAGHCGQAPGCSSQWQSNVHMDTLENSKAAVPQCRSAAALTWACPRLAGAVGTVSWARFAQGPSGSRAPCVCVCGPARILRAVAVVGGLNSYRHTLPTLVTAQHLTSDRLAHSLRELLCT